jgi:uncharacterized membrane protein YfcA
MFILTPLIFGITVITSMFTSALSAATGMGGGVLLFSVMSLHFPIPLLIPLHGLIQFFNNFYILIFLRKKLLKAFIGPFFLGCMVGIGIGAWLAQKFIQTSFPQIIIIIMILYTLFRPKRLPALDVKPVNFVWVGLVTGFLGILAGAIDPVLAPFFVRNDMTKEEIIANKSFMQAIVHLSKIPVFYFLGFDYLPYLSLCLVTSLACLIGTKFGIKVLEKINEKAFLYIFKFALLATGLRLAYRVLN